jgi:hypothetical protein
MLQEEAGTKQSKTPRLYVTQPIPGTVCIHGSRSQLCRSQPDDWPMLSDTECILSVTNRPRRPSTTSVLG